MSNRRFGIAVGAVFALALGLRLLPLAWSPYPATLDGIHYAALARDSLATGSVPLEGIRADNLAFTSFVATAGAVLGFAPLRIAQPIIAFVGAASIIAFIAIIRRFGARLGGRPSAVRLAAVLVGLGLAIDGLYLRRTSIPDSDILALLLLPVLVLALHRGFRFNRLAWLGPAGLFLVVFPLIHTFSTFVAGTTLVAWVVAARDQLSVKSLAAAIALVAGFWGYFVGYYAYTTRLGLVVPYVDRVTAFPGLFVAWLIAMVIGIWWLRRTSPRTIRAVVLLPFLVWFAAVFVNVFTPLFPGTVRSPGPLAALITLFLVPVALAIVAVPVLASNREGAIILAALLAAPITIIGFSLTASLTPEYFATVMRAQTFAHAPVVGLAAIAAAGLGLRVQHRYSTVRRPALVAILLAALLVTAPIAYVDLDTLAFPSTTTESEFEAASFVATAAPGPFASDHVLTRITTHYYDRGGTMAPAAAWLGGGLPPPCAALSARSWTTTGAHFFPAGPDTISPSRYAHDLSRRHRIYASGPGYDRFAVSLPRNATAGC